MGSLSEIHGSYLSSTLQCSTMAINIFIISLMLGLTQAASNSYCRIASECSSRDYDYSERCITAARDQIQRELNASMTYFTMASYFGQEGVTRNIKEIIDVCSEEHDHALSDYLTAVFMPEQLQGQRALAEQIATLRRMKTRQPELAEFLFDKTLKHSS